jgi:hypothetical protein
LSALATGALKGSSSAVVASTTVATRGELGLTGGLLSGVGRS